MTEYERMINGRYYRVNDQLREMSRRCREFVYEFNSSSWDSAEYRIKLVKDIFGHVGKKYSILQTFKCTYGINIYIGENFFANHDCIFLDAGEITIGDNVLLGPRTMLMTAAHPLDNEVRNAKFEFARSIRIGNDVWLGGGTIVNPGITIGSNVIIGSGSVVTHDIPEGVIAVGNPCRILRPIAEQDIIQCKIKLDEYFQESS